MNRKPSSDFSAGSRKADTTFLILASLADGEKHGYSLTKDVESFAGVRLAPGTKRWPDSRAWVSSNPWRPMIGAARID
jgi:hypothetical protein